MHIAFLFLLSLFLAPGDEGVGIDPNGGIYADGGGAMDPNGAASDEGPYVDPNG